MNQRFRQLVVLVLASVVADAGFAAPVSVSVTREAMAAVEDPRARIVARAARDPHGGRRPSRVEPIVIPSDAELDLEADWAWTLSLESEGWWAPAQVVVPRTGTTQSIAFRAVPTGMLEGRVRVPADEAMPEKITVRFETAGRGRIGGVDRAQVDCPVAEGVWRCAVPAAGPLDLRLRATGFVSHHRWDVDVAAHGRRDMGELTLVRGASVVGWVLHEGEDDRTTTVSLAIHESGAPRDAKDVEQRKRLALETDADDEGFFSVEGVPPGVYVLTAARRGYAETRRHPVTVMENAETELPPFNLARPVTFFAQLEPPTDPYGAAWRVTLVEETAAQTLERIADGTATPSGSWHHEGLAPGPYVVMVEDEVGDRYAFQHVIVEEGMLPTPITLSTVWVEGAVTLGDEPIEARLKFRNTRGGTANLRTDDEGVYQGHLAGEGRWDIDVEATEPRVFRRLRDVQVERDPGDLAARVDIVLPATEISGTVVDAEGEPVELARVLIMAEGLEERPSWQVTDEEGAFWLAGLAPGDYRMHAEAEGARGALRSEMVGVTLEADTAVDEQVLVLRARKRFAGVVVSPAGPVPAAQVLVGAFGGGDKPSSRIAETATTDVQGRFEVDLEPSITDAQVTVLPPGYALTTARVSVTQEPATIAVEVSGGDLVVGLPGAFVPGRSTSAPLISRDGLYLGADTLRQWAQLNGVPQPDPARLVVPRMSPGRYEACIVPATEIWREGRIDLSRFPCEDGRLLPFATLTLALEADDAG